MTIRQKIAFAESLCAAISRCSSCGFPSWATFVVSLYLTSALGLTGCSAARFPLRSSGCKSHTYINLVLPDYLKQRFDSQQHPRLAIVPFEVPETFSPPGNDSANYGRELARNFEMELHKAGTPQIVELFDRDRWPGKRAEFFKGNYGAIDLARAAGYDFVMVGYLDDLKDDSTLVIFTKIIDTADQITVWDSKTTIVSDTRALRSALSKTGLVKERPDLFDFSGRTASLASCTVDAILNDDPVPE